MIEDITRSILIWILWIEYERVEHGWAPEMTLLVRTIRRRSLSFHVHVQCFFNKYTCIYDGEHVFVVCLRNDSIFMVYDPQGGDLCQFSSTLLWKMKFNRKVQRKTAWCFVHNQCTLLKNETFRIGVFQSIVHNYCVELCCTMLDDSITLNVYILLYSAFMKRNIISAVAWLWIEHVLFMVSVGVCSLWSMACWKTVHFSLKSSCEGDHELFHSCDWHI